MDLDKLREDCAVKQKKGLHFILASIIIWCALFVLQLADIPVDTKNLYTFFCSTPLVPLAFLVSKTIKVDFQNKDNPLNHLGVVFSANQFLYLIIAMWLFYVAPETKSLLMVLAIIFGAHLLPYGWLYKSKTYVVLSVVIPIVALIAGLNFEPYVLAIIMIGIEMIFSVCLWIEVK